MLRSRLLLRQTPDDWHELKVTRTRNDDRGLERIGAAAEASGSFGAVGINLGLVNTSPEDPVEYLSRIFCM
jgi:hypothetical protein